jgi:hypothetical protein
MVGLTTGEYDALQAWDPRKLVALIRERDPLLLMDTVRKSWLQDPSFARAVEEGHARDGSSTDVLHGVSILWFALPDAIEVHLSVEAVALVKWGLAARRAHDKPKLLYRERRRAVRPDGSLAVRSHVNVTLTPEKGRSEITDSGDGGKMCLLRVRADARTELASMPEEPGTYTFPALKGVRFVVVTAERLREPTYPA